MKHGMFLLVCILSMPACRGFGQATSINAASEKVEVSDLLRDVPEVTPTFSDTRQILGMTTSNVWSSPIKCSPDGTIFVEGLSPPDYLRRDLYVIHPDGSAHHVPVQTVPGLNNVTIFDSYVTDSTVVYLDYANDRSIFRTTDTKTHPDSPYVVRFNSDGSFVSSKQLAVPFTPGKLAALPNGHYLILGQDTTNTIHLALVDEDGTFMKYVPISDPEPARAHLAEGSPNAKDDIAQANKATAILAAAQFVASGSNILLLQNNGTPSILEIGDGYVIRSVKLTLPPSEPAGFLVPSDKGWFLRTIEPRTDQHISDKALYQINPDDGTILRKITTSVPLGDIVCVANWDLIAYRLNIPANKVPIPVIQRATLP